MSAPREDLAAFIGSARWFGGKGRELEVVGVDRIGVLPGPPVVTVELARLRYADAPDWTEDLYQVPLVHHPASQEHLAHAFVGAWDDEDFGPVHAYDALVDHAAARVLLAGFETGVTDEPADHPVIREWGGLRFHRLPGHALDHEAPAALFSAEQSNSSVAFGEDSVLKVFRKLHRGRNPDIDIHAVLTEAGSEHVPALYGWLEADEAGDGEPLHLAMLQQFLRTRSDGWVLALTSVRDLFAEEDLHADEVGGDFHGESARLGAALASVHADLAAGLGTSTWGADKLEDLAAAMRHRLDEAVAIVPALAEHEAALRTAYAALADVGPVAVQRVHGDLHLGQTLRTVRGWKIVDFEGEPAKPLHERVLADSPWRDVAGMLRSFDYAAHAVTLDLQADLDAHDQLDYRTVEWVERNSDAFLEGYRAASGWDRPMSGEEQALLRAYQVDKAVYEAVYEVRNRPDWLSIPLSSIRRLASGA